MGRVLTRSISGFNLLELLIATAIAGILSSLIITQIKDRQIAKAKEAEAIANIRELIISAKESELEGDLATTETKAAGAWHYTLKPLHEKEAIATATPRDGEGRSLTVVITPKVLRFCWAERVDVPSCEDSASAGL
jgi:prepilin-type N-terminal cleavage/methylation domain-containing protein